MKVEIEMYLTVKGAKGSSFAVIDVPDEVVSEYARKHLGLMDEGEAVEYAKERTAMMVEEYQSAMNEAREMAKSLTHVSNDADTEVKTEVKSEVRT